MREFIYYSANAVTAGNMIGEGENLAIFRKLSLSREFFSWK